MPLIDADHRSLFDLVNRLHESLEAGESADDLDAVFAKLTGYIAFHFNREEKMLKACAYPDWETHRDEHLKFTAHIEEARNRHAHGGDPKLARELLDYLKRWLTHHFLIQDMVYKPFVKGNGLAALVTESFETLRPDRYPPSALTWP